VIDSPPPEESAVLRSPRRPLLVGLLAVAAVVNLVVGFLWTIVALPLAALLAVQAFAQARTAVVLGEETVTIRVGLFTRRVRWSEVSAVERDRALGIERVALTTERARYRLPVPSTGPLGSGNAYEPQAQSVERAWRRGRRR
jgi:uncharacterized membrane protein YdbT with pleckstrin-like domain